MSATALSDLISHKLEYKEPFSLIRLGDGEGVLLSVNKQSPVVDLDYLREHLGSEKSTLEKLVDIKKDMIKTILGADVVGVRDDIVGVEFDPEYFELSANQFVGKFQKHFKLRDCDKKLNVSGSRRIALLHASLSHLNLDEQVQYCSSWAHYDLHLSGSIFRNLMQQRKIGLISSRSELCRKLEDIFGIEVDYWGIPDMYRDIDNNQIPENYIGQLEALLQEQLVEFPGMLFLVGGGFYGKLYCDLIKSQGGVALDVGSLLDAWNGIHSRGAVYRTIFPTNYDGCSTPKELLLSVDNVKRITGLL